MIDNKDSQKRYRVDHLIENFADELASKGNRGKSRTDFGYNGQTFGGE
jgi:glycyl-tRNA synthetase